ncbi:hypothetical protein MJO29_004851 [Puccinia striiformis f. sp. tritici]|nr:hypothetical protein MJO29_004851 [Puccinia striiformis f. sp. tritici]
MLNLSKFVEEDDGEDDDELELKKNQKRTEWAEGKTRTQPSENWDDDFLFGSVSVSAESLPLPAKQINTHKKPGSTQSIRPAPSRSYHHQSNSSYSRPQQNRQTNTLPPPPPILLPQPSQDSLTPRKTRPSRLEPSSISTHPTRNSHTSAAHLFNTARSSPARYRPPLSRPPASAPSSRGQSVDGTSPAAHFIIHQSRVPPHHQTLYPRSSKSHQAVSSQDSVPSISDLSSIGFRSPSSSLSMTDDSRGDCSHSSGDHSARFRGNGSGNLSFNTETEFTEPDIELDWTADDTDHESHLSQTTFHNKSQRAQHQHQQSFIPPSYNSPMSPSSAHLQSSSAHNHHQFYQQSNPTSTSTTDLQHVISNSPKQIAQYPIHRPPAHASSMTSHSTSTSTQTSRSKKTFLNNPPATSPSATSSSSSIGYYQSNCSDVSLDSSTDLYSNHQHVQPNLVLAQDIRHPRQPPMRNSSCSSSSSNNFDYYHSGSESYDPATSGTETDGVSDHFTPEDQLYHSISSPTSSDHNRNTPTVSQRSRKQALYTRPSYANRSPGSSLAGSISTSTLNASETSLDSHIAALCFNNASSNSHGAVAAEDEKSNGKNPSRRRFRKKRLSTQHLNKAVGPFSPAPDSSTTRRSPNLALSHKASAIVPVYPRGGPQSGDLAFAADSDDEDRRQNRPSMIHCQAVPAESIKNHSRTPPRIPLSGSRGLNTRSRSTIIRPHSSMQIRNENKQCVSPPDTTSDESSGSMFKAKRPLSFTALFTRGSTPNTTNVPPINLPPLEMSHPDQLSRSRFGHRHSTSVDSTSCRLGSPPHSRTSNDSILSRVRRLSSRASREKNVSTTSPTRKRFSLVGDTSSRLSLHHSSSASSGSIMATPLKAFKAANEKFANALKSSRRQTSQSDSFISDVTLTALDTSETVRARRTSSRASNSNTSAINNAQISLTRKFSVRSSNKSSVHQPDLCHSPTDHSIDHDFASSSSQSISRFQQKRTLSSKPPKSNPALRARAEANAQLQDYQMKHTPHSSLSHQDIYSESLPSDSDLSPTTSNWGPRSQYTRGVSHPVPNSEPPPTPMSDIEHETHQTSHHLVHIGSMTAPLTRSNSMGELRIPSRITSQQGRLQTELNQVKEFARGIEELKAMRRTYRKMIRATHRSRVDQSFVITDDSDGNSTDSDSELQKDLEPLPDREHQAEEERSIVIKPNQVSPRALDRLYSTIQRIQEEYKEWWTCCNVLIELGEGSTDPRTKFTAEQVREITAYSQGPLQQVLEPAQQPSTTMSSPESEHGSHKHFEILRSMFGPGGEEGTTPPIESNHTLSPSASLSPSSTRTSPEISCSGLSPESLRCQTPPMSRSILDIDSGDKTPMSRAVDPSTEDSLSPRQPETPRPAQRKVHSIHLSYPDPSVSATPPSIDESQIGSNRNSYNGSSIKLDEWSETESSWNENFAVVDTFIPQSAPASSRHIAPSKIDSSLLHHQLSIDNNEIPITTTTKAAHKKRVQTSRYSSYQHHSDRRNPAGSSSASTAINISDNSHIRNKGSHGSRIGISGIKDFLRVLKARVNAEEKWPSRRPSLIVSGGAPSALSVVGGLKRRSVSSTLHTQQQQQKQSKKVLGGGLFPVEAQSTTTKMGTKIQEHLSASGLGPGLAEHVNEINDDADDDDDDDGRGEESVSSSEEECWDELFGFKDPTTSTLISNNTDSLDLAIPSNQLLIKNPHHHHMGASSATKMIVKKTPVPIGEGRLALSSDRMPQLLSYLNVVKEQCRECVGELKSHTV